MSSFVLTIVRFIRAFAHGLKDAEFRALLLVLVGLLVSGTIFYSTVEGWGLRGDPVLPARGLLDALYFSVTTLATVGYGDLHPTTPLSKVFTIVYIVLAWCRDVFARDFQLRLRGSDGDVGVAAFIRRAP